jgi:hypothetical protein
MNCTSRHDDLSLNFCYHEIRGCRTRTAAMALRISVTVKWTFGCKVGRTELNVVKRTVENKRMFPEADYDKTCRIQRQYISIKQCSLSLASHGGDLCSIPGHSIGICGSQTKTWTGLFRVLQFPLPLSFQRCSLFIKSSISDAKN